MCSRVNTVNITVLTSMLFLLIGCAGTLSEDEKYERQDAYYKMVDNYKEEARRCRWSGGTLVSAGSWSFKGAGKLSADQMSSARCVSRS